ncbi:MAG: GlsB/YeaQ/YmgE family stress response membrane protein [Gammaproteobacteria bacterium]|nr:GlsB/YeaQ/YmgE family stress response membrane protein [Gammaproteobacteria bacterium]
MSWLISIIIGGIIGWLASIIMKTDAQMGLLANVIVGIVGSMLGYWLAGLLGIAPAGGVLGFLVGIAGAVLLIFILGKVGVFRRA